MEGCGRRLQAPGEVDRETGAGRRLSGLQTTAVPSASASAGPAQPFSADPPRPTRAKAAPGRPVPLTTRRPLSVPRLIRPDRGGHVRPRTPAGRRGRLGEGREEGGKGEGAGGGGRSKGRVLRPWEAAAAAAAGSGPRGAGPRRRRRRWRKGPERGRESAALRKPETAGGPVAGPAREPGRQRQRLEDLDEGRASNGPGGVPGPRARAAGWRGRARWSRSTCAPRPAPTARPGRNRWVQRPRPPPPTSSLLPPPRPGSVQEMARDEVPSCFPAGAALPPPPRLLLARLPERLCPASRGSSPGAADDGPRRTVSALHRLLNFSLDLRA